MNLSSFAPVNDGGTLRAACEGRFDFSRYVSQRKIDGVRAMLDCDSGLMTGRNSPLGVFRGCLPRGCVLDGELVGHTFHAFDALRVNVCDVTGEPIEFRLHLLAGLDGDFVRVGFSDDCVRLAREVEADGGDGIVCKLRGSSYRFGGWLRWKRLATFDAEVLSIESGLCDVAVTKLGRVVLPGRAADVAAADVIEVAGQCLTPKGKWRHPRFVRLRPDKMAIATL